MLAGRFVLGRLVKEALGVATYFGDDQATRRPVVIKLVRQSELAGAASTRLAHEAELLASVDCPAVAPVLRSGAEDGWFWLALPRIEGPTLAERVAQRRLSVDETLALARRLATALAAVHARGILHRDLKPTNVVLGEGRPEDAVLIDFGFARSVQPLPGEAERALGDAVGTALYVSPEQAGLIDGGVDERSDLYSLGVVLYESLAGVPPFPGATVNEVLGKHLAAQPPELRLAEPLPRALRDVLERLLAKDPRERYQSASGLLHDLTAIARARAAGDADPALVVGTAEPRHALTEPSFIERGDELALLVHALGEARRGRGGVVLLEGFSGLGKSRLLAEATRLIGDTGAWILHGQGVDQAAQRPLHILSGVVAEAKAAVMGSATLRRRLTEALAGRIDSLLDILPEAESLLEARAARRQGATGKAAASAPEAYGEVRACQAGAALLDALGTPRRPALLLLDDCQWSDPLMTKLLAHWNEQAATGRSHTLVVCAFRTGEVALNHPLRSIRAKRHLSLHSLDEGQVRSLVESMAGPLPRPALETVTKLADGNPFMASAVLRGLVETGALRPGDAGWLVDGETLERAQSSRKAAAFLARRLRLLTAKTRLLLTAGAVLGKEFDVQTASDLADLGSPDALAALSEARRRGLIFEQANGAACRFVHDKLREALLDELSETQRRHWHRLAAAWLERHTPDAAFELAFHFDAAGLAERALPYALTAALAARSQHSLAVAEQLYGIAERGAGRAEAEVRWRIAQGLGEVLMLSGRYGESETRLEQAETLATDPLNRVTSLTALGELAFKRGDMVRAADALEQALRLLGRRSPRSRPTLFLALLWEVFVQTLHTLFPRLFLGRRPPASESEQVALRVYSRLAYAAWFKSGKLMCAWAHLKNLNVSESHPESPERAQAYSEHGPVMTMLPWFARGLTYVERSLQIRRRFGDVWGQGQSLHFLGVALYGASRYHDCIRQCEEAKRLLESTGDRWEGNTARWHIAYCRYRLGDLAEAVTEARQLYRDAVAIGDHSSAGIALAVWAKASGGAVPKGLLAAELARGEGDVHTRAELLQAEGVRRLGDGDPEGACEVLSDAAARVRAAGLQQEYVAPIGPWLATAQRTCLERCSAYDPRRRRRELRRALATARRAVRLARLYRNNLPHALRELALLSAMAGQDRKAQALLRRSLAEARRQGARYETLQSELALARLAPDAESEPHVARLRESHAALLDEAAVAGGQNRPGSAERPTLSVLDRLDTLLAVGPALVTALTKQAVYEALREAATLLLRGQRCLVLKPPADGGREGWEVLSGGRDVPFSTQLLTQALSAGHAVVTSDEVNADPSESLLLANVRSALCAPVRVRGRTVACLYASHGQVGGLYRKEDARVADFIAALAGASLENTESFAQLQILNDSLEAQVAERRRTAEELSVARQAADAANQAKSDFLANVSHEIRTPLSAMLGFAEMMDGEAASPEERRQFLEIIRRNGDQLLALLNSLLDLSKIEAGKLIVEPVTMPVAEELRAMVEQLDSLARQKGLALTLSLADDLPATIVTDPLRLRQILVNVVGNAVKFTNEGSVRVEALRHGANGLAVRVRDSGIGLTAEQAAELFQPFQQADASTARRFGGTGLGLILSRRLAQALGGDLTLDHSAPGEGSVFTITVAGSTEAGAPKAPAERDRPPARKLETTRLDGVKVLLIEDMPDVQRLSSMVLARAGAEVQVAADGRKGLAVARQGGFDLILLDIQLPEVDGIQILETLRQERNPVPIVMLTAHGMREERDRCYAIGCNDYIVKPVKPLDLPRIVRRNVEGAVSRPGT